MVFVVLVWWKIKIGWGEEFERQWREELKIEDKSGFVGEFLSRVTPPTDDNTWDLRAEDCSTYVNVGIWNTREDFDRAVGKYKMKMRDVERRFRVRATLTPMQWRIGNADLVKISTGKGLIE